MRRSEEDIEEQGGARRSKEEQGESRRVKEN